MPEERGAPQALSKIRKGEIPIFVISGALISAVTLSRVTNAKPEPENSPQWHIRFISCLSHRNSYIHRENYYIHLAATARFKGLSQNRQKSSYNCTKDFLFFFKVNFNIFVWLLQGKKIFL